MFLAMMIFVENYLLKNEDEKYDIVPEIWNGKNVADFVDPDLERVKLANRVKHDIYVLLSASHLMLNSCNLYFSH